MTELPAKPASGLEPVADAPTPVADTTSPDLNVPAPEGTWDNRATRRLKAKTTRMAAATPAEAPAEPWPLSVACPVCGAPERVWCQRLNAGHEIGYVHETRRTRALEAKP